MATQVVTPASSHNIMMIFNYVSAALVGILPILTSIMPVLSHIAPSIYGVVAALLPVANLIAHKSTQPMADPAPDAAPAAADVIVPDAAPITSNTVVPPMTTDGAPVVMLPPGA